MGESRIIALCVACALGACMGYPDLYQQPQQPQIVYVQAPPGTAPGAVPQQPQPQPGVAPQPGQPAVVGVAPQPAPPPGAPQPQPAAPVAGAPVAPAAPVDGQPPTVGVAPTTPAPYVYAQPQQPYIYTVPTRSHLHDGEVIGDFMGVGLLASIDLVVRQNMDANVGTWVIIAGLGGGGGLGYLLDQRFPVDAGTAHATTLGLTLGVLNGLLLIQPFNYSNGSSVLGLVTATTALGTGAGFAYGQVAHLTGGQAVFAANVTLLGAATAGLGSVSGSTNSKFGGWQDGVLALGLDGGAAVGLLLAPHINWTSHRSNIVMLSTFLGALAGGLIIGMAENPSTSSNTTNNDVDAAAITAGMWGGFALGILLTRDAPPPPPQPVRQASNETTAPAIMPWVGAHGETGAMAVGHF